MTDRPIIFSAPMVRALLDGRKTQTRRIITSRGELPDFCGGRGDDRNDPEVWGWEDHERGEWITLDQWRQWAFVPYRPGDRLWVREAFRGSKGYDPYPPREWSHWPVHYEADGKPHPDDDMGMNGRLRPSIHMPRWASRLTLVVTEVRVQRLQAISGEDCIAEGVECQTCAASWSVGRSACNQRGCFEIRQNFRTLWNSLHGPEAWGANPWVAAISFTVHRCNIDEMEADP